MFFGWFCRSRDHNHRTDLDTSTGDDISYNMVMMYFDFGLMMGVFTAVKSYQILTTLSTSTHHIFFWCLHLPTFAILCK